MNPGVQVVATEVDHAAEVLTPGALAFVARLHRSFDRRRHDLLSARRARQAAFDVGALPDFLP